MVFNYLIRRKLNKIVLYNSKLLQVHKNTKILLTVGMMVQKHLKHHSI